MARLLLFSQEGLTLSNDVNFYRSNTGGEPLELESRN